MQKRVRSYNNNNNNNNNIQQIYMPPIKFLIITQTNPLLQTQTTKLNLIKHERQNRL